MNAIEQLKSVLCDQTGKCCIKGSEEDRAIVDRALEALAQPEFWDGVDFDIKTTPPQRTWVGLTDDERINISYKSNGNECVAVELTEAKLKEKNQVISL